MRVSPHPTATINIGTIYVETGETLTVYLKDDRGVCKQVELRVQPDGTAEVFMVPGIDYHGFEDWTKMQGED